MATKRAPSKRKVTPTRKPVTKTKKSKPMSTKTTPNPEAKNEALGEQQPKTEPMISKKEPEAVEQEPVPSKPIDLRDPIAFKQGKAGDGTVFNFVSKNDIVNRFIDIYGYPGENWDFIKNAAVIHEDSVSVSGEIHILDNKEVKFKSPLLTGGCAIVPGITTIGEALMKAENTLFKRCASFFGINISDDAEPKSLDVVAPAFSATPSESISAAIQSSNENRLRMHEAIENEAVIEPKSTQDVPSQIAPQPQAQMVVVKKPVSSDEIRVPTYESLFPYMQEILTWFPNEQDERGKEKFTTADLRDTFEAYGVDPRWIKGDKFERVPKARYVQCVDLCKEILKAGPVAPVPVVEKPKLPVYPKELIEEKVEAPIPPMEEIAPLHPEMVPALGGLDPLDIGPVIGRSFAVMGSMINKIGKAASLLGMKELEFLTSKGVSVEIDDFVQGCSQDEFDALFT